MTHPPDLSKLSDDALRRLLKHLHHQQANLRQHEQNVIGEMMRRGQLELDL